MTRMEIVENFTIIRMEMLDQNFNMTEWKCQITNN